MLCGCPSCLKRDGLELVCVVPSDGGPTRFMLVDWFKGQAPLHGKPQPVSKREN